VLKKKLLLRSIPKWENNLEGKKGMAATIGEAQDLTVPVLIGTGELCHSSKPATMITHSKIRHTYRHTTSRKFVCNHEYPLSVKIGFIRWRTDFQDPLQPHERWLKTFQAQWSSFEWGQFKTIRDVASNISN
jgi:hypothetical protein